MSKIDDAVAKGKELGKVALYFGCWKEGGHYIHNVRGESSLNPQKFHEDIPWGIGLMDTGLLTNGKIPDIPNGKVYFTCGGLAFWYAFYWWDRSVDTRGACNSGFYVRGFDHHDENNAFTYACEQFPHVVRRQKFSLVLQDRYPQKGGY